MQKIHCTITTPEKTIFTGEVDELLVPTSEGQIGVLPHHIPLVSNLGTGELVLIDGDANDPMAITGGFLQIKSENKVVILADTADRLLDLDFKTVEEAKQKASDLLSSMEDKDGQAFADATAGLNRAIAQEQLIKGWKSKTPKAVQIKREAAKYNSCISYCY